MSRIKLLKGLAQEHAECHKGMFSICLRVILYSLCLMLSMFIADNFFFGSYTTNISLFMLFGFVFELLWNKRHSGVRWWGTVMCVIGIWFAGLFLINQTNAVEIRCQQSTYQTGVEK